jgi:hypothetical protein
MLYVDHRYGVARMRAAHRRAEQVRLARQVAAQRHPAPNRARLALAAMLLRAAHRLAREQRPRGDPARVGPS